MGTLTSLKKTWSIPRPHDGNAVRVGLERWAEQAARFSDPDARRAVESLAVDETGRGLLAAIFGNSPYLTQIVLRDQSFICR